MNLRLGLLLVLLGWLGTKASAQTSAITVTVVDSSRGEPVGGALIAMLDTSGNFVLSSTVTDELGVGRMVLPKGVKTVRIHVEALGYRSTQLTFLPELSSVAVPLVQLPNGLPEVNVRARRRAASVSNNDTARLDLDAMRDSTERSALELLAKAPGMQLDRSGLLRYRGREVNRVLLDNKDFFSDGGYRDALERLDASRVARADAIMGYHPDPVLARLEQSNEVIINLVTTDSTSGRPTGELRSANGATASGAHYRYDHRGQLLWSRSNFGLYAATGASKLASITAVGDGWVAAQPRAQDGRVDPLESRAAYEIAATTAWPGLALPKGAPVAPIGDARVSSADLTVIWTHGDRGQTRAQLSGERGRDALALEEEISAVGDSSAFRRVVGRHSRISGQVGTLTLEHSGSDRPGATSWRMVAATRAQDYRTSAREKFLSSVPPSSVYERQHHYRDQPWVGGLRLNRTLGSRSAAQAFSSYASGLTTETLALDIDTLTLRQSAQGVFPAHLTQSRNIRANDFRLGGRYFLRIPIGLVRAYADYRSLGFATKQRSQSEELNPAPAELSGESDPRYNNTRAGAAATIPIGSAYLLAAQGGIEHWRITPSTDARGPQAAAATGAVYRLSFRQPHGPLAGQRITLQRELSAPYLSTQPRLSFLADPFTLNQDVADVRPRIRHRASLADERTLFRRRLEVQTVVNYTFGIRQVTGRYVLGSSGYRVDRAAQVQGSGQSVYARLAHNSLRLRTSFRGWGEYARERTGSPLSDTRQSLVAERFTAQGEAKIPRVLGLISSLRLATEWQVLRGAVRDAFRQNRAAVDIRYAKGAWLGGVTYDVGWIGGGDRSGVLYREGAAQLSYQFSNGDSGSSGPMLEVSCLGIGRSRTVRDLRFSGPITYEARTATVPTTVVVAVRWPLKS